MAELKKYRLKPTDGFDAMLLDGSPADIMAVFNWVQENTQGWFDPLGATLPGSGVSIDPSTGFMLISTLNGVIQVKKGEWVIQTSADQFTKLTHEKFSETYETIDGSEMPQPEPVPEPEPEPPADPIIPDDIASEEPANG